MSPLLRFADPKERVIALQFALDLRVPRDVEVDDLEQQPVVGGGRVPPLAA
jgi:hypothetical protein